MSKTNGPGHRTTRKRGASYALRFRAYGARHYITLGSATEGGIGESREPSLRSPGGRSRGIWHPPEPERKMAGLAEEPDFHISPASTWRHGSTRSRRGRRVLEVGALGHLLHTSGTTGCPRSTPRQSTATRSRKRWRSSEPTRLTKSAQAKKAGARRRRCSTAELGLTRSTHNRTTRCDPRPRSGVRTDRLEPGSGRRLKTSKPRRTWLEADELRDLLEQPATTEQCSRSWRLPGCESAKQQRFAGARRPRPRDAHG